MHTLIAVLFFIVLSAQVLVGAASAGTVQDERAAREECSTYSQAGMRDCLAKKAHDSEKAVRQAQEKAISALSQWDEDAKYVALSKGRR